MFWSWRSANFINVTECFWIDTRQCFGLDTRQTWETLPSVFPSCTRQNRRHRVIPLTFFCRVFIDTRQTICRVRDKKHSANYCLPTLLMPCVVCRVLHSAKQLPSVFGPLALGKATVSCSELLCSKQQKKINVGLNLHWTVSHCYKITKRKPTAGMAKN